MDPAGDRAALVSEVAVIGSDPEIAGFALAGARVYPAASADEVRAAWLELPDDIRVVILTVHAADALGADRTGPGSPLTVVMPR
jgi:vacuolar-type H+-ATPase subunit F/Vma7